MPWYLNRSCLAAFLQGRSVWHGHLVLNAFLVLPLTDEGIAGSRHLNTVGLIAFALVHMIFFLVLSVLYGFLCPGSRLEVVDHPCCSNE